MSLNPVPTNQARLGRGSRVPSLAKGLGTGWMLLLLSELGAPEVDESLLDDFARPGRGFCLLGGTVDVCSRSTF